MPCPLGRSGEDNGGDKGSHLVIQVQSGLRWTAKRLPAFKGIPSRGFRLGRDFHTRPHSISPRVFHYFSHFSWQNVAPSMIRWPSLLVAVPVMSPPGSPRRLVQSVARAGGNAIELRADSLAGPGEMSPEKIADLARALKDANPRLFLILTPRSDREGGAVRLTMDQRRKLIEKSLPIVDAVDIELRSRALLKWALPRIEIEGKKLIVSSHDFQRIPSAARMSALIDLAATIPGSMLKVAGYARSPKDIERLCEYQCAWMIVRTWDFTALPLALLPMGPLSPPARLALAALGSRLAFAALGGEISAPGQIPLEVFARALRRIRHEAKSLLRAAMEETPAVRAGKIRALLTSASQAISRAEKSTARKATSCDN